MKRRILFLAIAVLLLFSINQMAFAGNVTISDSNLRAALYALTGTPSGDSLTTEKLALITGDVNLSGKNISSIDGIQYLTGASSIDLSLNSIGDVPREIEQLTSLQELDLSGNRLTRLPSNIGSMTGLKILDISANRLADLPSALTKLSLTRFTCEYNFFDLTDGSDDLSTIYLISAQTKEYLHQLKALTNLSSYSPINGTVVLYWDMMLDIAFDDGTYGQIKRFSVLDSGYNYVGEASPGRNTYEISGLNPATTYKYYISADYYILNTKYDSEYTKLYLPVEALPVPQNTPVMNATDTPTPTPEPTPEPATDTPTPATPTADTSIIITQAPPTSTIVSEDTHNKPSAGVILLYVILAIIAVVFIFVTLLLIGRAIEEKKNRKYKYKR